MKNIVLAHGILGFSKIGRFSYFNGVADDIRQKTQANIIAPAVDPTRGIADRAGMLRDAISSALSGGQLDRTAPVHIIAHSMGGLDARQMLHLDASIAGTAVATLVTIGTPHRGSPIADLITGAAFRTVPFLSDILGQSDQLLSNFLAVFNVSLKGLHDLTTDYLKNTFNPQFTDNPNVRYVSFAGGGRGKPATSKLLRPYYDAMKLITGEANDSVVAVSSAKWGTFDQHLWPADHMDEVGRNLDDPEAPAARALLDRYIDIVNGL